MPQDLALIRPYLEKVVAEKGSDLHIRANDFVKVRVKGEIVAVTPYKVSPDEVKALILASMPDDVRAQYETTLDADYAIHAAGVGRFRANAFRSRGYDGAVLRLIGDEPATLSELGMPPVVSKLALKPRGLVLVTGPTGSGKTTTLAGMIDSVNESRAVHILTLEDPIEVMHPSKMATVTQRELGSDTKTWKAALKAAMRQDPDVILIGEMRDADTVQAALSAAETGHAVFSTLHTTNALETIGRVLDFFPANEQTRVRASLSTALQGIICQRLIPKADGSGRACAMEIAVNDARLSEAIADPEKTDSIPEIIEAGKFTGAQSFDQHLLSLVQEGQVDPQTAIKSASNPHDFTVKLRRTGWKPTQGGPR